MLLLENIPVPLRPVACASQMACAKCAYVARTAHIFYTAVRSGDVLLRRCPLLKVTVKLISETHTGILRVYQVLYFTAFYTRFSV